MKSQVQVPGLKSLVGTIKTDLRYQSPVKLRRFQSLVGTLKTGGAIELPDIVPQVSIPRRYAKNYMLSHRKCCWETTVSIPRRYAKNSTVYAHGLKLARFNPS